MQVTISQQQEFILRTSRVRLPAIADRVDSFLARMLEQNCDSYLAHRVKPAVEARRAGNFAAVRRWPERAMGYLQTWLLASLSGARMTINLEDPLCWAAMLHSSWIAAGFGAMRGSPQLRWVQRTAREDKPRFNLTDQIGTVLRARLSCARAFVSVWEGCRVYITEFLRENAAPCRALANEVSNNGAALRGMMALALELDAQAVAVEAGRLTAREIEAVPTNGGEKAQPD